MDKTRCKRGHYFTVPTEIDFITGVVSLLTSETWFNYEVDKLQVVKSSSSIFVLRKDLIPYIDVRTASQEMNRLNNLAVPKLLEKFYVRHKIHSILKFKLVTLQRHCNIIWSLCTYLTNSSEKGEVTV